jgi:alpha-ketoglutarate-dependent taurine dioxygenase
MEAAMSQLEIRPMTGALGAELHGVDLGRDLDGATIAAIRRALLDHCVVFFRDQRFDAEQHKALARRFGAIFVHPNYAGTQADPEIVMIRREPGDTRIVGEEWHTDTTMMAEPPMGAILHAIEVPPYGGDTLFANRKLLFVNASYTMGFEDWTEEESRPLLCFLLEHGHRPEFTCRFRWARGSVAFWDNRCVKHLAVHDAQPFRRLMRRVQIAGEKPY